MDEKQKAGFLLEQGEFREASEIYEGLCAENPDKWDFWTNLAICQSRLEDHLKAIASARRGLELAPVESSAKNNLAAILIDAAMQDRSFSKEQRRNLATEGVTLCDELLVDVPSDSGILYNKANGLSVLGEHQEAKKILQTVVKLRPGWDEAIVNLGNSLKSLGRGIEALDYYKHVLDRNPRHWNALVNIGEALVKSSTIRHVVEDANRYFRTALGIRPDYLPTLGWLAYTELLLGNEAQAEEILEHILLIDPTDEPTQYWLRQIRRHSSGRENETI